MKLTRRGVVYTGSGCDLNCNFCYDRFKPHRTFFGLRKIRKEIMLLAKFYRNSSADIYGGEPAAHPGIAAIVSFAAECGLMPTVVTNGCRLSDMRLVRRLKNCGVHDFLVTLNGPEKTHNRMAGTSYAYRLVMKAFDNLSSAGIPFRTNTVVTAENVNELPITARLLSGLLPVRSNFIMFNPLSGWTARRARQIAAGYSAAASPLSQAFKVLDLAGIPVRVRYMPFCTLKGNEERICNYAQIPFDPDEYDFSSWLRSGSPMTVKDRLSCAEMLNGRLFRLTEQCLACGVSGICGGFNRVLYSMNAGTEAPYTFSAAVTDPLFFRRGKAAKNCKFVRR